MKINRIPTHARRQRGAVLILTLWLIVVLTVMAYSLAYEIRLNMKMAAQNQRRLKAKAIAMAGLAKAAMDLRNSTLIKLTDQGQNNCDTKESLWAQIDDKTDVEYGDGTYSVRIIDEESKLNINNLQPVSIPALRYLLEEVCGMKDKEAETVASAIFDFKDQDLKPIGGEDADEQEYYTEWGLEEFRREMPDNWIFRPKNDNFLNLDELLAVPGITSEMLYGDTKDAPIDPIERADWEEGSPALADYLTICSTGNINVNTCSLKVLEAVLTASAGGEMDLKGILKEIDKVRQNPLKEKNAGTDTVNRLKATDPAVATLIENADKLFPLKVDSTTFTVISRGDYKGVHKTIKALVKVDYQSYDRNPGDDKKRGSRRDRKEAGYLKNMPDKVIDPSVRVLAVYEL